MQLPPNGSELFWYAVHVPPCARPPHGVLQPSLQLALVYEPVSEPLLQVRVWLTQALPEGALAWYAVTDAPLATVGPHGAVQLSTQVPAPDPVQLPLLQL